MATGKKDIEGVLKQERARGKKRAPPVSDEAYRRRLERAKYIDQLLDLDWMSFKAALNVAGLQEGSTDYDLAVQGWKERQRERRRR
jgi:hypothetical protein